MINKKSDDPFYITPVKKYPLPKGGFKKFQKKFYQSFYFSPKKRSHVKEGIQSMKQKLEFAWNDINNPVLHSIDDRKDIIDWTAIVGRMETIEKKGEEWTLSHELKHKRFSLYYHQKTKDIIIETRYFKVAENREKVCNVLFKSGLPKPMKDKIGQLIREEISKEGWNLIGKGTFFERFLDFYHITYTFKGKNFCLKLNCRLTGKAPYIYRFSVINPKQIIPNYLFN